MKPKYVCLLTYACTLPISAMHIQRDARCTIDSLLNPATPSMAAPANDNLHLNTPPATPLATEGAQVLMNLTAIAVSPTPKSAQGIDDLMNLNSMPNQPNTAAILHNVIQRKRIYKQSDEKHHKCTYQGCDYATDKKTHLDDHIRIHTGEKPYKCPHPGCDHASTHQD